MGNMELKQATKDVFDEFNLSNVIYRITMLENKFKEYVGTPRKYRNNESEEK